MSLPTTGILVVVHTDAPLRLLGTMVSQTDVAVGQTPYGEPDCIYGWLEPQKAGCRPHHLVYLDNEETARWLGWTLKTLGYQVVGTNADMDVEIPVECVPTNYDWHHNH